MKGKLTRREVSDLLHIPLRSLDYLVRRGEIPFSRIGKRSVRFDPERVQQWFEQREGLPYHLGRGR